MSALGFKAPFAPHVINGRKPHTIRHPRKRPVKVGEKLFLYTGMRTKSCTKIGEATCLGIASISITPRDESILIWRWDAEQETPALPYDRGTQNQHGLETLIHADGFDSAAAFWNFFREPMEGHLIWWGNTFKRVTP